MKIHIVLLNSFGALQRSSLRGDKQRVPFSVKESWVDFISEEHRRHWGWSGKLWNQGSWEKASCDDGSACSSVFIYRSVDDHTDESAVLLHSLCVPLTGWRRTPTQRCRHACKISCGVQPRAALLDPLIICQPSMIRCQSIDMYIYIYI